MRELAVSEIQADMVGAPARLKKDQVGDIQFIAAHGRSGLHLGLRGPWQLASKGVAVDTLYRAGAVETRRARTAVLVARPKPPVDLENQLLAHVDSVPGMGHVRGACASGVTGTNNSTSGAPDDDAEASNHKEVSDVGAYRQDYRCLAMLKWLPKTVCRLLD